MKADGERRELPVSVFSKVHEMGLDVLIKLLGNGVIDNEIESNILTENSSLNIFEGEQF